MGLAMNHSYVVVPSAFWRVARRRPLETSVIPRGTVMAMRWLSGSSACVSLLGHHALAPSPCTAVAMKGPPMLSRFQAKPPSHGGLRAERGLPLNHTVTVRFDPTVCGEGRVT